MGPVPRLGKTVELALVVWVRQTLGHESKRSGPTPRCLLHWASWLKQCWRAYPGGGDEGNLVGRPAQLPSRLRTGALS